MIRRTDHKQGWMPSYQYHPKSVRKRPDGNHGTKNRTNLLEVKRRRHDPSTSTQTKLRCMSIWIIWIRRWYPRFHERAYIVPPVHFNRVKYHNLTIGNQQLKVLKPTEQLSDVREDESQQRFHAVLSRLCDVNSPDDVMFVICDLDFDNILNTPDPSHVEALGMNTDTTNEIHEDSTRAAKAAAPLRENGHSLTAPEDQTMTISEADIAASTKSQRENDHCSTSIADQEVAITETDLAAFPRPRDLQDSSLQRGRFDVLIIHREKGVILFKIKAMGDAFGLSASLGKGTGAQFEVIRRKVGRTLKQLDKEERTLRYQLEDVVEDVQRLPVTKGLVLPNLTRQTVRAALMQDTQLCMYFCQSLRVSDLEAALDRCVFSEQLPPIGRSVDVSDDVIQELRHRFWKPLKEGIMFEGLSEKEYEAIIARLCGPATRQYVNTARIPRADVSTLSLAVMETALCFSHCVLTEQQISILGDNSRRVFLTGPPATGKSLVLSLKVKTWLEEGRTVVIVSLWEGSDAVSQLLFSQLKGKAGEGKLHLVLSGQGTTSLDDILKAVTSCRRAGKTTHTTDTQLQTSEFLFDPNLNSQESDSGFAEDTSEEMSADLEDHIHHELGRPNHESTQPSQPNQPAKPTQPVKPVQQAMQNLLTHHARGDKETETIHCVMLEAPWFFQPFVSRLEAALGREGQEGVVVWAASSRPTPVHHSFQQVTLTQALRCPPSVVWEMEKSAACPAFHGPRRYTPLDTAFLSGTPYPTDGPAVKRIRHVGKGHFGDVWFCEACGEEVGSFLTQDLQIGLRQSSASTLDEQRSSLRFSDVLISGYVLRHAYNHSSRPGTSTHRVMSSLYEDMDDVTQSSDTPGFLAGLKRNGVQFNVIKGTDTEGFKHLATPQKHDHVQIAEPENVMGLERPVVVVIGTSDVRKTYPRYVDPGCDVMSRCTGQLILVGELGPSLENMFTEKMQL